MSLESAFTCLLTKLLPETDDDKSQVLQNATTTIFLIQFFWLESGRFGFHSKYFYTEKNISLNLLE
jgi:hypothetical protein